MNLSVIRKIVQLIIFIFMVYGATVVGFYSAEKLTNSFASLSCAYDANTADYCTLIPLQHQLDHRLGPAISAGTSLLAAIMPTLITLGTFLLMFVILNKAFCGWICPLGLFQEILTLISQKLGLRRYDSLPRTTVLKIRPIKWLVLIFLVLLFPLLTGLGMTDHALGSPFCSICPSRILTTLANGDGSQVYVDHASIGGFVLSLIANLLFGLMLAWGLFVRQPFCRICPMLALHASFRKLGLLRLVREPNKRCSKCNLCAKACPMDIDEIADPDARGNVVHADCTLCGRCVEFCPDKGKLKINYVGIPLFSSSPAYFKKRKQQQASWEGKSKGKAN